MKEEKLSVPRERTIKYKEYFKRLYNLNEEEKFWNLVITLCENPECDVNELCMGENDMINVTIKTHSGIPLIGQYTQLEFAQKISKEIIENEHTPIDKIEILQMKTKLLEIEQRMMKNEREQQTVIGRIERNFTEIGEKLYRLQNTVSRILKELETEIGNNPRRGY